MTKVAEAPRRRKVVAGGGTGNGHWNDGAEDVAKASKVLAHPLSTRQVRMLQALREVGRRSLSRKDLKTATGDGKKKAYHRDWRIALRDLIDRGLVRLTAPEPAPGERQRHLHWGTAPGRQALEAAEKALEKKRAELAAGNGDAAE